MDKHPEKLLVRAIIPHSEDPELYVLDAKGCHPSAADHIRRSQEELLHEIGQTVLSGGYLAIDKQLKRSTYRGVDGRYINVSDLRAEPLDPRKVTLNDGYSWQKI